MWADREPDGFFKNLDGSIDEDAVTGRMMYHEIADHQYTKAYVGENNLTKANAMNLEQEASKTLKEAGIPGIKYFDGNSRNAGEGTRNFVMFRDDLIEIAPSATDKAASLKQTLKQEGGWLMMVISVINLLDSVKRIEMMCLLNVE